MIVYENKLPSFLKRLLVYKIRNEIPIYVINNLLRIL